MRTKERERLNEKVRKGGRAMEVKVEYEKGKGIREPPAA